MSDICSKLVPKVTLPVSITAAQATEACEKESATLDSVATGIDEATALVELNKIVSGLKPVVGSAPPEPVEPIAPPDSGGGLNWQTVAGKLFSGSFPENFQGANAAKAKAYEAELQFVADHLDDFGTDQYASACADTVTGDEATACGSLKGALATFGTLTNADAAAMSDTMLAAVNKIRGYSGVSALVKGPVAGPIVVPVVVPASVGVSGSSGNTPLGFGVYPISFALNGVQFIDEKGAELDGFRAPEFVGLGGGDNAAGYGVSAPLAYLGYRSDSLPVGAVTGRWSVGGLGWFNHLKVNTKDTKLDTDAVFNEGFGGAFGKFSFEFTKNIGLSLLFSLGYLGSHGNEECLSTGYDMPNEVGCVKASALDYDGMGGVALLSFEAGSNDYVSFSFAAGVVFGLLPGLGTRALDSSEHDLGGFTVQIPTLDVGTNGARWFLMLGLSR